MLAGNELLRLAEREPPREDLGIARLLVAGQHVPDPLGNGMVTVPMPTDDELGLLLEIFETGHRRATMIVGGLRPSGFAPMRPTTTIELSAASALPVNDVMRA